MIGAMTLSQKKLIKFLKDEMHASRENIKFFEHNYLSTIKEITVFGINDIYLTLHKFLNYIQDQAFLNSVTMVHHLVDFFKIVGEETKSKDSAVQTPNSSIFLTTCQQQKKRLLPSSSR